MPNPKFHNILKRMAEVHDRKSSDYANSGNYYANFESAATTAGITVDEMFMGLIGVKLARLKELKNKPPSNESVQDSRLDLAVYCSLWASYHEVESVPASAPSSVGEAAYPVGVRPCSRCGCLVDLSRSFCLACGY